MLLSHQGGSGRFVSIVGELVDESAGVLVEAVTQVGG